MIIYILSYCALAVAILGLVVTIVSLIKKFHNPTQSIVDVDCEYLNSDCDKIKHVSMKYSNKIRGSVRLSQGRIKSIEELKNKEKNIMFP